MTRGCPHRHSLFHKRSGRIGDPTQCPADVATVSMVYSEHGDESIDPRCSARRAATWSRHAAAIWSAGQSARASIQSTRSSCPRSTEVDQTRLRTVATPSPTWDRLAPLPAKSWIALRIISWGLTYRYEKSITTNRQSAQHRLVHVCPSVEEQRDKFEVFWFKFEVFWVDHTVDGRGGQRGKPRGKRHNMIPGGTIGVSASIQK